MARFSDVFAPKSQKILGTFTAGDLEVDSDTISVDATNNRIGMGVTDPDSKLEVLATSTQQKWSYDADSFATVTVADASHTTIATGESGNLTIDVAGDIELNADGGDITFKDASTTLASLDSSGNLTALGDIILDDGGSLKEAGGTAAITFDGSGNVTKIGQDSLSSGDVLTYDGSKWVGEAPTTGDITGVTAGDGLAGGGSSGAVTLTLDLNELSAATVAVAADSMVIIDADSSNEPKKESIADFVSGIAGTGLSASSGQLAVDSITSVGAVDSGSITSGFGSIDVGSSTITTTGNISGADVTVSGGDISFGNGQNATASVAATAHNAAGKNLTITAGPTTAGTTNNIAGGSLTLQAGQGKGSGAGGDIVFQTANAGGSGSSLNSHATALTISDDLGATFAGDVIVSDGNLKLGSTAVGATAAEINAACDASARSAAAVAVADDHFLFCDGGATGATKVESIADLMTAVAGTQATTGLTASSGTLVVTDLHPVGVSGSANQLLTDDGDGTLTSEAKCLVDGAKLTIGDATAEDTMLVFDGNAADFRVGLDDGTDSLEIGVGATHGTTTAIGINANAQSQAFAAFAANVAGTFGTFADEDATPSVATGNLWKHHASTQTITMFDDGIAGQTIHVISTAAITYDVTGTNLKGGSTDIVTASGDITSWFFDGTNWYLIQFMDVSADMSSVGGGGGTDLNGLSAAAVDVAADSIGIIDANDSNNSKKESIADLVSAMAGTGLAASSGQLTVNAANTGTALASGGVRSTADQAGEILAMQVFS
jgi:hypothetical protein